MEIYDIFDKENHLQPDFNREAFNMLQGWDFGWEILKTINIAKSRSENKEISKRFSPGQKALYFFWYLDAQVTNGGFIQFYWNDYGNYIPTIKEGLKLINDQELIKLIDQADKEYWTNKSQFDFQKEKDNWEPLYSNLKQFDIYDSQYFKIHNNTMELIEKFAKSHPEEFVNLI